jgi:hypothetical protein
MTFKKSDRVPLSFLAGCLYGGILALDLYVIGACFVTYLIYYLFCLFIERRKQND